MRRTYRPTYYAGVHIVVVGAGLSGLMTARLLGREGVDVTVVEAADRVGGRTVSEQLGNGIFDLGGQWIGPQQSRMAALVCELGLATFPTYDTGRKVLDVDGRTSTYAGAIPSLSPVKLAVLQATIWRIDRLAARVHASDPWAAPRAVEQDSRTLASWMRGTIPSATVRGVMAAAVRVIFGAEPEELSLLFALWYIGQGGGILPLVEIRGAAQETRLVNGADSVSRAIAMELGDGVVLSAPITEITQNDHAVDVRSGDKSWSADRVIVTSPSHMTSRIRFQPGLPAERGALMQRIPMGGTIKFHALYEGAFWREAGLSGEMVCTSGPVSVVFDGTSHDGRQPALTGFCVGGAARRLTGLSEERQRGIFEDVLVRGFGPLARDHTQMRIKDWCADPWARGCPTGTMPPGVMSMYGPALRVPVGRIHWAGTETATEWTGYMEGAVQSAERVVAEVLS